MWRGKTRPEGLTGEDIPVGARIARLTGIAVLFESIGGRDLAVQAVRRRGGGMLDPSLVARLTDNATEWLTDLAETEARSVVLDTEPHPPVTVSNLRLAAEVFGDLADLKSPYLLGCSRTVATCSAIPTAATSPSAPPP
jgi:hypothetical protein